MPTRLKRLDLHGFKSFATPTTFVFDPGITAVIGPNGSGKSNIADALRWVLGEQSYATLRGRRTEDVIFAGSAARTPLGMAEVALTLDNESGDLPTPFAEVTITRRAYRSGENQYLINGARVRLKDVAQVTAALGQAYTVIGQGLVDSVLAQRPEERRGLFEHAAGITGLRLKHAESERHLAETQTNSARLEDLLREVEPRLRGLERAARQAREYDQLHGQLQATLRRLHAHLLRAGAARLADAEAHAGAAEEALADLESEHEHAASAAATAATALAEARAAREALSRDLQQFQAELREAQHRLALATQRRDAARRRGADLGRRSAEMARAAEALEAEMSACAAALAGVATDLATCVAELDRLEEASAEARRRSGAADTALRAAESAVGAVEREIYGLGTRRGLLEQREEDAAAEAVRLDEQARDLERRSADLDSQLETLAATLTRARGGLERLLARRRELEEARERARPTVTRATEDVRTIERRLVERSTRLETLGRLRDSGAGLQAGTRTVLDAAQRGTLGGVVGALASLIQVPSELEAAIEAGLGGHLQDIVVEHWADAEAAIEHLRRSQAGRATFQPLDTLRGDAPRRARLPSIGGIRGVAADLISRDPRVAPVVAGLLGRVLVADDLSATRAALRALPPGWSIVTLSGEITRSSGAVTGGARVRESGTLARERELRELPAECRDLERRLGEARAALTSAEQDAREVDSAIGTIDRELAAARETLRDAESRHERVARWRAEVDRGLAERGKRSQEIQTRRGSIAEERRTLEERAHALDSRLNEARAERDRLAREVQELQDDELSGRVQEARATQSRLLERRRATEGERDRLATRRAGLARETATMSEQLDAVAREAAALDREIDEAGRAVETAAAHCAEATSREASVLDAVADAERHERDAAERSTALATRVREAEHERDRLVLEWTRRGDEVELLRERAARDLELPPTDLDDAVAGAVESGDTPDLERLQREAERLRERLRRVGAVGDDAVEQYEREAERHAFLRGQLDDVRSGGEALRALLAELERAMATEFERTFGEVATAFESTFTRLFGGGRARLVRADDDGAVGVDILAQPPGKRLQSLALLSGGERALTAVALLFAILNVNPSPFCLLDEVDAALDEANVVRVSEELRLLAEDTQFVVVTHNRATIEGSDTLYGVTMGSDGVSRVLSLRLPAAART